MHRWRYYALWHCWRFLQLCVRLSVASAAVPTDQRWMTDRGDRSEILCRRYILNQLTCYIAVCLYNNNSNLLTCYIVVCLYNITISNLLTCYTLVCLYNISNLLTCYIVVCLYNISNGTPFLLVMNNLFQL